MKKIKLSKSSLGDLEKRAVQRILEGEFLGMGQEVGHFEAELTNFLGRPAVCVATGTAALHLALQAIDLQPGDEVLVQSLTYVASFQAIVAAGAIPVACDIHPDSLAINLADAQAKLSPKTKAIMPVYYAGKPQQVDEITKFARINNLRIIEDSAHAFGSRHRGQLVGSFGDITCFSFDGIKNITSGEGGCIVTDDTNVIRKVKDSRLLGVIGDSEKRINRTRSWQFDVEEIGWRYHMSDIMASIGRVQLKRMEDFARKRRSLCKAYNLFLENVTGISPVFNSYEDWTPHIYPIKCSLAMGQNEFRKKLLDKGIETGLHYAPNHLHSIFRKMYLTELPVTESLVTQLVSLPLHVDLTQSDLEYVCSEIKYLASS